MNLFFDDIEKIKNSKATKRERAIFDLWEKVGEKFPSEQDRSYIIENIVQLYPRLNFDQQHAALQVLLKLYYGEALRELVFEFLGKTFDRYRGLACLLSNYLYVLNDFDSPKTDLDIGPWELDKTLAAVYARLKEGNSPYL